MKKAEDYIENIDGAERRYYTQPVNYRTEKRGEGEEEKVFHIIEGIAAKVNSRTSLGWFDEMIMPGAFDEVLKDDVRALFNHDPNYPLARSVDGKGTLALSIDDNGNLAYSFTTPNRSYALDLQDAIASGDVSQSSFAFSIKEEAWERSKDSDTELRKIVKLERLYDVSPVTYPAYADTSVAKRSFEAQKPNIKDSSEADMSQFDARLKFLKLKNPTR